MSRNVLPMLFGGLAVGTLLAGTSLAPGLAQLRPPRNGQTSLSCHHRKATIFIGWENLGSYHCASGPDARRDAESRQAFACLHA